MNYYDQTDKADVEEIKADLIENGFEVSVTKGKCKIVRETSKYNKYMKWHAVTEYQNGGTCGEWFKSKPEAIRHLTGPRRPMPIGNRMSISYVELIN